MGSEVAVGSQTEQRGGQQRERDQHEPAGHQDVPGEDRHPEHRHTRGTHTHDRGDHVHGPKDGADPADGQTHDPQVSAHPGTVYGIGKRRIGGPAKVGGAARRDEPGQGDQSAAQKQPVGQGIQARKSHIWRADMQRQHQIGEAEHDRRGVEQQHDRAVHGEQLVVLLIREELKPGMNQFSTHQQGHQPAHEEKAEAGDDVHHADQLVIGGAEQPVDESAAQTPRRKGALGRHRHEKLRLCAHPSSRRAVAACPWTRDRFRVLNMVTTQQMRCVSTPLHPTLDPSTVAP
ncbi:Uncharacterised protein [Mycobacteroides abscessus subsp. abscessus]|nr:Uncharacterised protein [Mycobacteroides abscessus subsp. abscessus]SIE20745.1 Uncharacterised protein [Mycobacteroides abscessus subsp. abscessus]SIE35466.1 Uncharacterised protein [Mycobacteroides abscessus subsp. abscessus]SIN07177.1 Uncharacterised protein [Mycobacteroides abscessus subsp. abscessus]SKN05778.1 Uncharacterised protein [Mycobacteroides abscessus subsp. abscessus]